MNKIVVENIRLLFVSVGSSIMGLLTPTKDFLLSLVILFAFNIFCGMRADNITIKRCKNFTFKKFSHALIELLLYITIIQVVYNVMYLCGDKEIAIVIVKSITYIYMYVYLSNSFRNLIAIYPKNKVFRIIYHLIRFEITKAFSPQLNEIVKKYEGKEDDDNT